MMEFGQGRHTTREYKSSQGGGPVGSCTAHSGEEGHHQILRPFYSLEIYVCLCQRLGVVLDIRFPVGQDDRLIGDCARLF